MLLRLTLRSSRVWASVGLSTALSELLLFASLMAASASRTLATFLSVAPTSCRPGSSWDPICFHDSFLSYVLFV